MLAAGAHRAGLSREGQLQREPLLQDPPALHSPSVAIPAAHPAGPIQQRIRRQRSESLHSWLQPPQPPAWVATTGWTAGLSMPGLRTSDSVLTAAETDRSEALRFQQRPQTQQQTAVS